jgi:hydroxyacylglutathione hydrolase
LGNNLPFRQLIFIFKLRNSKTLFFILAGNCPMLFSQSFTFNPFQENTFVLWEETKSAIIIDPGCFDAEEQSELRNFIQSKELRPEAVWLTHAHIDHILGLDFCLREWRIPFFIHPEEMSSFKATEIYAPNYGFHAFRLPLEEPVFYPKENKISLGKEEFEIRFVPGHCLGHVAFLHKTSGQVWAGDVLFRQSIGRTDLPGGNFEILANSIKNQLYTLPDETIVYPGHGPETKIGFEKKFNPFVQG